MNVKGLGDVAPWDWPEGTDTMLLKVLQDDGATESDLFLAIPAAGDIVVVNDDLVDALLSILRDGERAETLRARAAIGLGPVLEHADTEGFDDSEESPITERTFQTIQRSLRMLYSDAAAPKQVRRRILEASVRAPEDWHRRAVAAAWSSGDEAWMLTAVFCMRFVRGFDEQILDALESQNRDIHYEAVVAAGNWGIERAWPHVAALLRSSAVDKDLLLAGIEAVASIRPDEAFAILNGLADSDDEDIVNAVHEALTMAQGMMDDEARADDDEDVQ